MVVAHAERPYVDTDGRTLGFIGAPANVVKANLVDHTVKWKASLNPLGIVEATAPVSWALAVQTLLGGRWEKGLKLGDGLKTWLVKEINDRLPDPDADKVLGFEEYTQPEGKAPRPYQLEAAAMLSGVSRGFLFDDPGTGKTISAILGALRMRQRHEALRNLPVLVVAPPSVVDPWVEAWHEWTGLSAVAWRGSPGARKRLMGSADVYVVGYSTIRNDAALEQPDGRGGKTREWGPLLQLNAGILILDEVQALKNPRAVQSLAARRLAVRATGLICLSGTPITHNAADLWPALEALDPVAWPSRERFVKRYLARSSEGYEETVEGFIPEREPEFRASLKGQVRRVSKEDVLDYLPPKIPVKRYVELPPAYRKAYDEFERDMVTVLPNGEELSTMDFITVIQRLLQVSCAPIDHIDTEVVLVEDKETGEMVEKERVHVFLGDPSWKIDELVNIVAERPGRQGLVFAPSAQLINLAAARLENEAYRVGRIIGGQRAWQRTGVVDAFQAGGLDLVCATTQSGGTGLTLTAASYVVFLQRPWSYTESLQAEDRAHRMGSEVHEAIEIIDIIAKDTVDERVRDVIMDKSSHLSDLLQDPRIREKCLGKHWKETK